MKRRPTDRPERVRVDPRGDWCRLWGDEKLPAGWRAAGTVTRAGFAAALVRAGDGTYLAGLAGTFRPLPGAVVEAALASGEAVEWSGGRA